MTRRLYRIHRERMIGGVAAGIAEYFDLDPVLIRIAFIILAFQGGAGVLAYIILWIVVPERQVDPVLAAESGAGEIPAGESPREHPAGKILQRQKIAGVALIVAGLLFLLDNFIPWFSVHNLWPLVLIGIGGGLLWRASITEQEESA